MAITTQSQNGVIITSGAKESAFTGAGGGSESTLGSQAGANADQIIVPNAIGTNNEGNLEAGATYVGRLIMLRPENSNREVRYITADSSNTLTVHEDWDIAPASGDHWALSYIIQDAATVTGLGLINKRVADYSSSRRFQVGNATNFAFFAMVDGVSLETVDNGSTTVADFIVNSSAYLYNGYSSAGSPVSGGYIIGTPATNGELVFDVKSGGNAFLYDWFLTCVYENKVFFDGNVTIRKGKIFSGAYSTTINGTFDAEDLTVEGKTSTTDTLLVDDTTTINGMAIISTNGFTTLNNATTQTITLSNVTFVGNLKHFLIYEKKTINLIDPVSFAPVITDQTDIDFEGTNRDGVLNEQYSLNATVQEADGTAIASPRVFLYEGTQTDSLDLDLTGNGSGVVSSAWTYKNYVDNANTSVTVTTYGGHAIRVYSYGYTPFVSAQTSNIPFSGSVTLTDDGDITQASQATAITNGSGITITRHGTGETDTRPMKVFKYDAGTGTVPTVGETVTQGSATGVVVEYIGDAVAGTLVVDGWNGTEFTDNSTITGGTSSFSATTDTAGFYQEYTWEVNCNALALTTTYDYLAAKMAQATLDTDFTKAHVWGGDEQAQLLYNSGSGYITERNVSKTEGVWVHNKGAGTIAYLTSDAGTQYVPPIQYTFTISNLDTGSVIRIYQDDGDPATDPLLAETDSSGISFAYNYIYGGSDVDIYVVVISMTDLIQRLFYTLSNANQTQVNPQSVDRVYKT